MSSLFLARTGYWATSYTPPKKVLGHLWFPLLSLLLWWFFSEALSISPRVLISEMLGRACPVLWISIICSGFKTFNHLYLLEKELIALQYTSHEISVFHVNLRLVLNVIQTINPVHFTMFGMQKKKCLCHEVYPESSHYCKLTPYLPPNENTVMHVFYDLC